MQRPVHTMIIRIPENEFRHFLTGLFASEYPRPCLAAWLILTHATKNYVETEKKQDVGSDNSVGKAGGAQLPAPVGLVKSVTGMLAIAPEEGGSGC